MKKIKLDGNLFVSGSLVVLSVISAVLSNKKQTNDIAALKSEVTKDVIETLKNGDA